MMVVASWQFDEEPAAEDGAEMEAGEEAEPVEETAETGESEGTGLMIEGVEETEAEVEAENDDGLVLEDGEASEVGSVFSGAGIAAIIAAVVLAIAAAGIAILKKKKK